MENQEINDLVYACAAGCLDYEDYPDLAKLKESDANQFYELGELQNVISLIPIILEIDKPDIKLKDKVARKLYRMRDEILAKRNADFNTTTPTLIDDESFPEMVENDSLTNISGDDSNEIPEVIYPQENYEVGRALVDKVQIEELKEKMDIGEELTRHPDYIRDKIVHEDYQPIQDQINEQDKKKFNWFILILILFSIVLTIAASLFMFNYFNKKIESDKKEITALTDQVRSLDDEVLRLNRIQRVLSILGSKEVLTLNLDATVNNPMGFGKITIDPAGREGLLQLYNMPSIKPEQIYQLWLIDRNESYSLGTYRYRKEGEYLTINQLPDLPLSSMQSFILTLEYGKGSSVPAGDVFLSTPAKRK